MNKNKHNSRPPRYALIECDALLVAMPVVFVLGFWLGTLVH